MIKRNSKGQFVKGSSAPKTAFKKGNKPWNYHFNWKWKEGKPKCIYCKKFLHCYHNQVCRKCYNKYYRGEMATHWKGGKHISYNRYIYLFKPSHPYKNINNYIAEHRLVAEKYLNRYLTKQEHVHHINGIKDDNRPENLYLFSSNKEHINYHYRPYQLKSNLA